MKRLGVCFAVAAICALPLAAFAVNEGASVTAPFVAVPPTIDGVVSAGEWDGAAEAPGDWSDHGSATLAANPTTVKVLYSVDALYLLYECPDAGVESLVVDSEKWNGLNVEGAVNSGFGWSGATDYVSLYVDPSNYADDAPAADEYSYSIQWEPSITANGEMDADGNSYNFTELGRWGGFPSPLNPFLTDLDGNTVYWSGGVGWQHEGLQIVDGPMNGGYVCEVKVPYAGFTGYYRHQVGDIAGDTGFVNVDASDPVLSQYGTIRVIGLSDDTSIPEVPMSSGVVAGMPAEGTVWKIQFCRYDGTDGTYTNWVGDTGGFVSRPFGNLIFGPASGTAVRDAMLH